MALEIDLAGPIGAASAGEEIYEDVTSFPAIHQDLAVVVPVEVAAAEVRAAIIDRRRRAAALGRGLRPLRGRAARRRAEEPGAAARVPRRRPHPHRRGGRRRARLDRVRADRDRRDPPWLSARAQPLDGEPAARVLVAGASGFTGALAAQIVWRHPSLELVAITSRSDAGTRLDRLYPRYRVPLELTELDLDALEGIDAAIVAYPHGAAAPTVAALRGLGILVVDLSADFRLRDLATYERWYGEHGAPELLEGAVYGLTELYRDQLARGRAGRHPRLLPDRERAGPGAARRTRPARPTS